MAKVKHTKNELKKQKDDLRRFSRYLPTLMLKKKQLQAEVLKLHRAIDETDKVTQKHRDAVYEWVDVFTEAEKVNFKDLLSVEEIKTSGGNIAGIDIPVFDKVSFKEGDYDLFSTPLWVDYGIEALKKLIVLKARRKIQERQLAILQEELRITTQRVSLFEKVKIPEAKENIRRIKIFLGDLQTQTVVTGKIAKKKIEEKAGAAA